MAWPALNFWNFSTVVHSKDMHVWEYCSLSIVNEKPVKIASADGGRSALITHDTIEGALTKLGEAGWEAVENKNAISGSYAIILKRPLVESCSVRLEGVGTRQEQAEQIIRTFTAQGWSRLFHSNQHPA